VASASRRRFSQKGVEWAVLGAGCPTLEVPMFTERDRSHNQTRLRPGPPSRVEVGRSLRGELALRQRLLSTQFPLPRSWGTQTVTSPVHDAPEGSAATNSMR